MATRAHKIAYNANQGIKAGLLAGGSIDAFAPVKFDAADDTIVAADPTDDAIGIALAGASSGDVVDVLLSCLAVLPVTVGTGGATRGARAVRVANGYTDAAALGGGTVSQLTHGFFLESGSVGHQVALAYYPNATVTA